MDNLKEALKDQILIFDGGMGTMLQSYRLEELDYRGELLKNNSLDLKGNNDILSLTRPDLVAQVHELFLEAGANLLETNTFNANSISQSDYATENLVYDMNRSSAEIAKKVVEKFGGKTRFVCGAIGPTNKTGSLSPDVNDPGFRNVNFDELVIAYSQQVKGLVDGGVDVLLLETVFDTLNCKAALFAIRSILDDQRL